MHRIHRAARAAAVAALALVAARSSSAQNVGAGAGPPFHAVLLTTGMTTMSVDPLNARMTSNQFAGLSNDAVSYGASGYFSYGRALLGAELHRIAYGEEGLNNGRTDDLRSMQGMLDVGYAVVSTRSLSVFPLLGVGLGRVDVALRDRNGTRSALAEPSFDEIARTPGPESVLSAKVLLYSIGGGADYLVTPRGASVGIVLGVRAGVQTSPNRAVWTRDGQSVAAGPDVGPGGRYVRITVGIGGR
ncbi:MAG: hypothetical protein ABI601_08830 [bacterium]